MVEFSLTEIGLFCWAVLATAYALRYKQERRAADMFIRALLSDKEMREHIVADFAEFKRSAE